VILCFTAYCLLLPAYYPLPTTHCPLPTNAIMPAMQKRDGMPLVKAFRVERGAVVSFVGGGGKTSSMFRLARELAEMGWRVVTTTTTHISQEQVSLAPAALSVRDLSLLGAQLDQHRHCLVIGAPDGKGRVYGASLELIALLSARPDVDAVLVEADGSRSRPFKAPGEHEPVVPPTTTILVPVVGLNSLGMPMDENHVHRAEIAATLAGVPVGSPVTVETIARVLAHREGGAKQLPERARLVPLLNKADTDSEVYKGRKIAELLLSYPGVDTVAICSMPREAPVVEAWAPAAAVILAAGQSTRFGAVKQLLRWGETTLAAHSARTALEAGLDPVIVVLGHEAEKIEKSLMGLPVKCVFNPEFAAGQSTSLSKGVAALPVRAGAALFLLADQPLITADILQTLVQAHRRTFARACVPVFEEQRGNPVLFDRSLFAELGGLRGDTGGRVLLEKYPDEILSVPAVRSILQDIDTREDFERLRQPDGNIV
jgi:molybdenum cofactor cytidylyltransferase